MAVAAASEATDIALRGFGSARASIKADRTIVTDVDHEIQAHVLGAIARRFPDHAVIAEEAIAGPEVHADARTARYCWVVDPLDGTRNYASGFACFATSIAVLDRAVPIVAVVVEHNTGQTFTALAGDGALLNGERIHAAPAAVDDEVLLGIPSSKDALSVRAVRAWAAEKGLICRNLGSAAYHLALVACGAFAGTFCKQCKIWDIAAGALLVHEAGGVATDERGRSLTPFKLDVSTRADVPIVAAARGIHQRLLVVTRGAVDQVQPQDD